LLKNNPNQSANENVVQAAPVVGWGFVLTGGDARARLSYAQFAKAQVAWQQSRNFVSFEGKPKEYNAEC